MLQRIFYVTQDELKVIVPRGSELLVRAAFTDTADGVREFAQYLAGSPDGSSAYLVDVIEEEFVVDSLPKLNSRDRRALMERRIERRFRRTPYRASDYQGKQAGHDEEFCVLQSAIINHELLQCWTQSTTRAQTPVAGIYSVPHMAPKIAGKLFSSHENLLFVATHQGDRLRQVLIRGGKLKSARLSRVPDDAEDFADVLISETTRSRRYYERTRLLGAQDTLRICVVADETVANRVSALAGDDQRNVFSFIAPQKATRKLAAVELQGGHFENAYVSALAKARPRVSYATSGEGRYWHLRRARTGIIAAGVVVAGVCSMAAAVLFSESWLLNRRVAEIDAQVEQLSETFRRENERFNPIKADSYEMKLAVDTGDYLLANRLPVPWVMNQLGAVLGDYPDVVVKHLHWKSEVPVDENARRPRPGDAPLPVAVPQMQAVSATIDAELQPYDGNLRAAFARIDEVATALQTRTHFDTASVVDYPFNAAPQATVSGEIVGKQNAGTAAFSIRITYSLRPNGQEVADESI